MSEGILIEVMGHKGKITRLLPIPAGLLSEERITAVAEFDRQVDGMDCLYVRIPVKEYTREELIMTVQNKAQAHFMQYGTMRSDRKSQQARKKEIEALVERVKKAVGLEEAKR